MQKARKKVKRIKPVIKVRESEKERESELLIAIRKQKTEVDQQLKLSQKKYIEHVEQLNQLRASNNRTSLQTLEVGLDVLKKQWMDLFLQLQDLTRREQAQIHQLSIAVTELKAVEKLSEKYKKEFEKEFALKEQRDADESTLFRLIRASS